MHPPPKDKTPKRGKRKQDNDKMEIDDDDDDDDFGIPRPLDEDEIALLKNYGKGPYTARISALEQELEQHKQAVLDAMGVTESDTGLLPPSEWDLNGDRRLLSEEAPLHVANCAKIISRVQPQHNKNKKNDEHGDPDDNDDDDNDTTSKNKSSLFPNLITNKKDLMYVIKIEHYARYVVGLGEKVAPTDIEEGMRVGVDRATYAIQIPLPSKIDTAVSLMTVEEKPDVSYEDVGGAKEAMERLREVMELPLLHPERFLNLGIDPPKGVLLYGPPGTGKTLAARAVANRTDACFIRVIGSELVRKYVGEGARMVRQLFAMARTKRACIIFFDEIDAIGGARHGGGDEEGTDNEVQRTMLQIASELDGFDPRGNIKVLMATNRPDILDPSLVRPGRLDRKVEFSIPDLNGRVEILKIHCRNIRVDRDIRYELIARLCPNTTGADLRSVCTEAGMFCLRERRKTVSEQDFLASVNKVIKGYKKFSSTPKYMVYN